MTLQPAAMHTLWHGAICRSNGNRVMHLSNGVHGMQVPEGHVWLQGDNAINSTDSRHYGPVPYALLRGRAFLKVSRDSS